MQVGVCYIPQVFHSPDSLKGCMLRYAFSHLLALLKLSLTLYSRHDACIAMPQRLSPASAEGKTKNTGPCITARKTLQS